jgi:glutamyl-tRNA synthetase
MVRTRFAPSPTGFLHIGGARTALFSWAFARKHKGQFVLRIEDTDLERSTEASVNAILDSMDWLGLEYDEGPFFQMQRMDRYKEAIQQLLDSGNAYYCYATKEELDELRARQMAAGIKPRYDGRWRDSAATPPTGIPPVVRFKNPTEGAVVIDDLIKGRVVFQNSELDDFIIARADGTPTYNFCVVVDDWDMNITYVIRGDDHLNNTPRQINVLKALGAPIPEYAHVPMILGNDGERLSKRHGAVSVMQYKEEGYLPEALLNFLARLSWGHGDDEKFSMQQFIEWFDLDHVNGAPARFNTEKLHWLNQQYIKETDNTRLAALLKPFLLDRDINPAQGPDAEKVIALMKERAGTLAELANMMAYFYIQPAMDAAAAEKHLKPAARPLMQAVMAGFQALDTWNQESIHHVLQSVVDEYKVGFGKVAMPLRLMVTGTSNTPSIDAVLELIGQKTVINRMQDQMENIPPEA